MRGWCLGLLGATLVYAPLLVAGWRATERFTRGLRLDLFRKDARRDDDLFVSPGTRGYLDMLRTGPQHHRYDPRDGRTTILDEVWLGPRSVVFPVAVYDGRPSRDVTPERVRRVAIPFAFLFVRRGDAYGEGQALKPGRTLVEGRSPITLGPGEIAWVTVLPTGLVVDERDVP
jgi:hypothetical protein